LFAQVFNSGEWEELLLKYVVPKLGATLRDDFRVNPRNQNMLPLTQVLQWSSILRASTFGHLLEVEFFPKWLDVLHVWLVQPKVNFEEVAQWYSFWKGTFPEGVQRLQAVEQGFTKGLQMMNHALELGIDAPTKLPKPDHRSGSPGAAAPPRKAGDVPIPVPHRHGKPSRMHEITFRSIVEEYISQHNLLFMPAGRVHEKSRLPLFRVSKTVDGKGGLLVYLLDDAVWAPAGPGDDDYRAVTLEDMVVRASKA
jgi:tuftelin-interacting protein 11